MPVSPHLQADQLLLSCLCWLSGHCWHVQLPSQATPAMSGLACRAPPGGCTAQAHCCPAMAQHANASAVPRTPHSCIWCPAGCYAKHAQFFDLQCFNVVLVDQRGCGRSTPVGCLQDNTTQVAAQMCSNACISVVSLPRIATLARCCLGLHLSLLVRACTVQVCSNCYRECPHRCSSRC